MKKSFRLLCAALALCLVAQLFSCGQARLSLVTEETGTAAFTSSII